MGRREQTVSDLDFFFAKKHGRQHFLEDVYSIPLVSAIEEENSAEQSVFVPGRNTVPTSGADKLVFGTGTRLTVIPCKSFAT